MAERSDCRAEGTDFDLRNMGKGGSYYQCFLLDAGGEVGYGG